MSDPRNIIFLHIPKCAGSTLQVVLSRQYPDRQIHVITGFPSVRQSISMFQKIPLARRKYIRCLMGHGVFGLHSSMVGSTEYITMLRRPVDRVISNYYYVARTPKHRHHETVTGKDGMSLYEYVSSGMNKAIDNQMVRHLTSDHAGHYHTTSHNHEVSERKLVRKAKKNLDDWFGVVGLVEFFDESLLLAKERYGWEDVSYRKRNVTHDRPSKEDLPARVMSEIEKRNRLDAELYEYGKERMRSDLEETNINQDLSSEFSLARQRSWIWDKKTELVQAQSVSLGIGSTLLHS